MIPQFLSVTKNILELTNFGFLKKCLLVTQKLKVCLALSKYAVFPSKKSKQWRAKREDRPYLEHSPLNTTYPFN